VNAAKAKETLDTWRGYKSHDVAAACEARGYLAALSGEEVRDLVGKAAAIAYGYCDCVATDPTDCPAFKSIMAVCMPKAALTNGKEG
jgi:hypothetical protein